MHTGQKERRLGDDQGGRQTRSPFVASMVSGSRFFFLAHIIRPSHQNISCLAQPLPFSIPALFAWPLGTFFYLSTLSICTLLHPNV